MGHGVVWAPRAHPSGHWVLEQSLLLESRVQDRGLFLSTVATAWSPTSARSSACPSPPAFPAGWEVPLETASLELFWERALFGRVSKGSLVLQEAS